MNNFTTNLKVLGLSNEEIQIYIAALQQKNASVLELARNTKIPRTTVYLLIDSLIEKNLLRRTVKGKKKRYVPAKPQDIIAFAKAKQLQLSRSIEELEKDISHLDALYQAGHTSPRIQYYTGVQEVQTIYEETLECDMLYVHCMSQHAMEIMGDYLKKYFTRIARRMIHTQELVSDSPADKQYQQEYATSRNQIVCIPAALGTNTDYIIYADKVAFITYKEGHPVGVVIHDKEIVHFEKIRFQMIWKQYV